MKKIGALFTALIFILSFSILAWAQDNSEENRYYKKSYSSKEIKAQEISAFNREVNRLFKLKNHCAPINLYTITEMGNINSDNFIELLTLLWKNKEPIFNLDRGKRINFNAPTEILFLQYLLFLSGKGKADNDYQLAKKIVGIPFVENNKAFFRYLAAVVSIDVLLSNIENKVLSDDYYTIAIMDCFKKDWSEYN